MNHDFVEENGLIAPNLSVSPPTAKLLEGVPQMQAYRVLPMDGQIGSDRVFSDFIGSDRVFSDFPISDGI
jgi:hypothetical protein